MGNNHSTNNKPKNRKIIQFPTFALGRHSLNIMRNKYITERKRLSNDNFNPKVFNNIFPSQLQKTNRLIKRFSELSTFCDSLIEDKTNIEIDIKADYDYEITYIKSAEEIRRSYIARLITKNVWNPIKLSKSHNTLFIYDWDDTFLPTTFLTPNKVFSEKAIISDKDLQRVKKLEHLVYTILSNSIERGDTYIVTNAAPGWVEYSCKRFYPEVIKILDKINIISARGDFEKVHPGNCRKWKILAFLKMLENNDTSLVTNLVCVGDSIIEMEAAHILASKFNQAVIKTIKFKERPGPEELNKELNLLIKDFYTIVNSIENLIVKVDKRPKTK